ERAQAWRETSLLKGSTRFQPVDGGSGGGLSLGGQPEGQRQANDRRDERSTRHRPLLAHFVLARVFGSPSLPEEHAGVADDAVGVAAGVRAGAVADGLARVQQIEPAQRVQHDERRQQTAHADLVLQRRPIHLGRIGALERNVEFVKRVEQFAREKGCTPGQLVLAWLLAQGSDIVPIPGTKRRDRVEENVGAAALRLSADEVKRISDAVPPGAAAGLRYP